MKSFTLAATEAADSESPQDAERLPFQMEGDDAQLYAYRPQQGQLALLIDLQDISESTPTEEVAAAAGDVMGVFWELMDTDTRKHLRRRLRSRTDAFDIPDIMNIIEWLVEEAAARPTTPPSGSTRSPGPTGQRSTGRARQRASTRSPSARTGSAT